MYAAKQNAKIEAGLVYKIMEQDRWDQGQCIFIEDVAEKQDFDEVINKSKLDRNIEDRIVDTAVAWADAASKEAFVAGYMAAVKMIVEGGKI